MIEKDSKKTIKIFALASFLNDFGSDMIYPIWPLFVTSVLGAPMTILGFIDGLGDVLVSLSQGLSGYLADRIRKRKVFIWTGYLFGSVSRIGYALSTTWQHLIFFRILDRSGKIRSAPRDAIIADISTEKNRGKNFGILRAADNLGAVCGILLCILLFELLGYKKLFLIAAIPSIGSSILILFFIKESRQVNIRSYKSFSIKYLNRDFKIFLILSSIFAIGSFSYSFLMIYAKEFGFKTTFVPVFYLMFTVTASLFSIFFGKLSDKVGRKSVLIISYIFWGIVCLSFIFIKNYTVVALTFILYGLHKAALEPSQKAFVSEICPEDYRSSSLGIFQVTVGILSLPASLIAGILWDKAGIYAPFYFSLCMTSISILILAFVKKK